MELAGDDDTSVMEVRRGLAGKRETEL